MNNNELTMKIDRLSISKIKNNQFISLGNNLYETVKSQFESLSRISKDNKNPNIQTYFKEEVNKDSYLGNTYFLDMRSKNSKVVKNIVVTYDFNNNNYHLELSHENEDPTMKINMDINNSLDNVSECNIHIDRYEKKDSIDINSITDEAGSILEYTKKLNKKTYEPSTNYYYEDEKVVEKYRKINPENSEDMQTYLYYVFEKDMKELNKFISNRNIYIGKVLTDNKENYMLISEEKNENSSKWISNHFSSKNSIDEYKGNDLTIIKFIPEMYNELDKIEDMEMFKNNRHVKTYK